MSKTTEQLETWLYTFAHNKEGLTDDEKAQLEEVSERLQLLGEPSYCEECSEPGPPGYECECWNY